VLTSNAPTCGAPTCGGARLQHADLTGAYLLDADLRGANLEEVDLRGANLEGALGVKAVPRSGQEPPAR
jgi:uncharacterized protein YjbI with pentapeptide repeats